MGKKGKKRFAEWNKLISPEDSYRNLREAQNAASTEGRAVVPHFALYAIDLEHLTQVPDTLENGMVLDESSFS